MVGQRGYLPPLFFLGSRGFIIYLLFLTTERYSSCVLGLENIVEKQKIKLSSQWSSKVTVQKQRVWLV